MTAIITFARMACRTGIRSRGLWLMAALAIALVAAGWLSAAFSPRQPLVVAVDVGVSVMRLALLFLALIWVQQLLASDIDRRNLYWILALPIERHQYFIGRVLGIAALLLLAAVVLSMPVVALARWADWGYHISARPDMSHFLLVALGLYLECLVVLAVTSLLTGVSSTPFLGTALGAMFAVAARSLHSALDFLLYSRSAPKAMKSELLPWLDRLQWLVPDLSRLDWRTGVLYGTLPARDELVASCIMAVGYILVLMVVASWLFSRRNLD